MKRRMKKVLEVLLAVVISVSTVGETSFAMKSLLRKNRWASGDDYFRG